jgi:hypothetical protein
VKQMFLRASPCGEEPKKPWLTQIRARTKKLWSKKKKKSTKTRLSTCPIFELAGKSMFGIPRRALVQLIFKIGNQKV